jgi:hypothetical protein
MNIHKSYEHSLAQHRSTAALVQQNAYKNIWTESKIHTTTKSSLKRLETSAMSGKKTNNILRWLIHHREPPTHHRSQEHNMKCRKWDLCLPVTLNVGDEDEESLNFTAQNQRETKSSNLHKVAEMGKLWNSHSSLILIGILSNGCLRVSKKTPLRFGPLDQSNIFNQRRIQRSRHDLGDKRNDASIWQS